ncbi:replicative DNA helicase [Lysinibacter sp. HNR]|uniref:replicative DNA helicase n=1 Tax=Lysinibacter sp. HNR TaxID=3031408 RepID=UPI00243492D7|nr:replicative DNA helicase [Lysinibacter sp. HNR]WGD38493.1 replicative DNA helicase [Lysinibacter sp. HNR]
MRLVSEAQYDREAEQSALGGMMLSKSAVWEVMEVVQPGDFYEVRHEQIAAAIVALATAGSPTDPIAVFDHLRATGATGVVEAAYLHQLVEITPSAANAGYYADIVRDRAELRRLAQAASGIAELVRDAEGTPAELVERARGLVDDVSRSTKREIRMIGESLSALYKSLEEKPRFVETPWVDLNRIIGGMREGTLTIVGARPGIGKTALSLQIAAAMAETGTVGYVSLEMSEADLQKRLIAQTARVPMQSLMNNEMMPTHWQMLAPLGAKLEKTRIAVADDLETITQVKSYARSLARRGDLKGFVVDYMQLMTSGKREESRQQEVSGFSRALKILSGDLGVPVIALSQLNRAVEGRKSGEPQLADLRESGSIEQDADLVILLHREEKKAPNDIKLIVAKNRHGERGDVTLKWEGKFARAISRPWSPTLNIPESNLRS